MDPISCQGTCLWIHIVHTLTHVKSIRLRNANTCKFNIFEWKPASIMEPRHRTELESTNKLSAETNSHRIKPTIFDAFQSCDHYQIIVQSKAVTFVVLVPIHRSGLECGPLPKDLPWPRGQPLQRTECYNKPSQLSSVVMFISHSDCHQMNGTPSDANKSTCTTEATVTFVFA